MSPAYLYSNLATLRVEYGTLGLQLQLRTSTSLRRATTWDLLFLHEWGGRGLLRAIIMGSMEMFFLFGDFNGDELCQLPPDCPLYCNNDATFALKQACYDIKGDSVTLFSPSQPSIVSIEITDMASFDFFVLSVPVLPHADLGNIRKADGFTSSFAVCFVATSAVSFATHPQRITIDQRSTMRNLMAPGESMGVSY
eukprot:g60529.t1